MNALGADIIVMVGAYPLDGATADTVLLVDAKTGVVGYPENSDTAFTGTVTRGEINKSVAAYTLFG